MTGGGFPDLAGTSWKLTAQITVPEGQSDGTLVENGSHHGGWGLYLKDRRPLFLYRASSDATGSTRMQAPAALSPGAHDISIIFTDNGQGKPGRADLVIDGKASTSAEVAQTLPVLISDDATIGWSFDPMDEALAAPFRFPGTIDHVDVDVTGKASRP